MATKSTYKYKVEIDQSSLNQEMMAIQNSRAQSIMQSDLMTQSIAGISSEASLSGMAYRMSPGLASLAGVHVPGNTIGNRGNFANYSALYAANSAKGVADYWGGEVVGAGIGLALTGGNPLGGLVGGIAGDFLLGDAVGKTTNWAVDSVSDPLIGRSRMAASARLSSLDGLSQSQGYKMARAAFNEVGNGGYNTMSSGLSYDDMSDIGAYGFQSGNLSGDDNTASFVSDYKNLLKKTKEVMRALGTGHKEVLAGMKELQNQGIFNIDDAAMEIMNINSRAAISPFSKNELMGIRNQGYGIGERSSYGGERSGAAAQDYSTFAGRLGRNAVFNLTGQSGKGGAASFGSMVTGGISQWADSAAGQHVLLSMMESKGGQLSYDNDFAKKVMNGDVSRLDMLGRAESVVRGQGLVPGAEKDAMLRKISRKFDSEDMVKMMGDDVVRDLKMRKMDVSQGNFIDALTQYGMDSKTAQSMMVAYENPDIMKAIRYNDATAPWLAEKQRQAIARDSLWGQVKGTGAYGYTMAAGRGVETIGGKIAGLAGGVFDYFAGTNHESYGNSRRGTLWDSSADNAFQGRGIKMKDRDSLRLSDEFLSRKGDFTDSKGNLLRKGFFSEEFGTDREFRRLGLQDEMEKEYGGTFGRGGLSGAGDLLRTGLGMVGATLNGDIDKAGAISSTSITDRYVDRHREYKDWSMDKSDVIRDLFSDRSRFSNDPETILDLEKKLGTLGGTKTTRGFARAMMKNIRKASKSEGSWKKAIENRRTTMFDVQAMGMAQHFDGILDGKFNENEMTKATFDYTKEIMTDDILTGEELKNWYELTSVDQVVSEKGAPSMRAAMADMQNILDGSRKKSRTELLQSNALADWVGMDDRSLTLNALGKLGEIVDHLAGKKLIKR